MKDSNDIANLYKTLGQNPNQYQEVVRDEELAQANERWPLIAAMHDSDFSPPPVDQKKRGPRERAPVVELEHKNELEVGAHDYHARVETANVMALLADPAMTPSWAPDMHDVLEVVVAEPPQDLIETGWIAPERTAAQIELATQAAQAAEASHQAQLVREAQAAKDAQAQRDLEAAQQEQAELAAEAVNVAREANADRQALAAQATREAQAVQEGQVARAAQDARDAHATQAAQASREAAIVKAAQDARDNRAAAKQVVQAVKPPQIAPPVQVSAVVQTLASSVVVIEKVVPTVSTSIFQDDAKVQFAGAPVSIFSEATLAESLMDEAAADHDQMAGHLGPLIDDVFESFAEKEIAPVVVNPNRQRVAVGSVASPKIIVAKPASLVAVKNTPTISPESVSVVTLSHMRMRATGEPRPLAALFNRLSGSAPATSDVAEGKKSLLFERMKRT